MELDVGSSCSLPECKQLDFLPFKCDGCKKLFCKDHREYSSHSCTNPYPDDKKAVVCPMCGETIKLNARENADQKVELHINSGRCKGKQPAKKKNTCSYEGCRKRELSPVTCSYCKLNYCLSHRFEQDHECPVWKKQEDKRRRAASNQASRQRMMNPFKKMKEKFKKMMK